MIKNVGFKGSSTPKLRSENVLTQSKFNEEVRTEKAKKSTNEKQKVDYQAVSFLSLFPFFFPVFLNLFPDASEPEVDFIVEFTFKFCDSLTNGDYFVLS